MEAFIKSNKPEVGSLLKIKRKYGYYHYGIYIGNDQVIHFSGHNSDSVNNSNLVSIRQDHLNNFIRGDNLEYLPPIYSPFKTKEIISRAEQFKDSKTFFDNPYNFVTNNCEHFARYIFYGKKDCTQVKTLLKILAIATALGASASVAIATAKKRTSKKEIIDNENN